MAAPAPTRWHRLSPRADVRTQLLGAALLWAVAGAFLLVRGAAFLAAPAPGPLLDPAFYPVALAALVLGLLKARFVLRGYAGRAVARVRARGRGCFFGLFGRRAWAFVLAMMTAGIALRGSPLADLYLGRVLLCLLYLAVGTALLLADFVFWSALFR
jgi:hypothetical protein